MKIQYLELYADQEATFNKTIVVEDETTDQPINISNYTFASQIRRSYYSTALTGYITCTIIDAVNGRVTLSIPKANTAAMEDGRYYFDVIATNTSTGASSKAAEGILIVRPTITLTIGASGVINPVPLTLIPVYNAANIAYNLANTANASAAESTILVNTAIAAVTTHEAASDPHPQYHTDARGDSRYDATGDAAAAVTAHEAASDPHPQYHTDARGDARYPRLSQMISWLGDTLVGIIPWRYVPPTTDPTAPKFNFSVSSGQWHQGPVGEPDYWDHTASLGWNFLAAAREDTSQSAFGITFESKFYQGTFGHEFHLQQTDSAGVFHRPLSFFLPTNGGAGSSGGIASDVVYLHADNGAERVTWSLAGATPVMHLLNNVQIWSGTNNNSVMRQINAAGTAYLALPYYNNENRMILDNPVRIVAAIQPGQYTAVEAIITSASPNDTLYNIAGPAVTGGLTAFLAQASVTDDLQSVFSNSGDGASTFVVRVKQNSTADPRVRFENNGVAHWTIGSDSSDGHSFKIGGYTLETDTKLRIDANAAGFSVPVKLPSYTVATVPSAAAAGAGAQIYVSNESGGAVPAFSDGTSWRRVTDRAVVS